MQGMKVGFALFEKNVGRVLAPQHRKSDEGLRADLFLFD